MKEKYESLSVTVLKDLAKKRGMRGISALKKDQLVEAMLAEDEKERIEKPVQEVKLWDIADVTKEVKKILEEEKRAELERQRAERFRHI